MVRETEGLQGDLIPWEYLQGTRGHIPTSVQQDEPRESPRGCSRYLDGVDRR